MINKVGKITIYVEDQEAAKTFWTETIGFVVKFEQEMAPGMKWLEVAPSEEEFTTFVLYNKSLMKQQNPAANVEHPTILLSTTDIEKAYSEMKEKGVEVGEMMRRPFGTMFNFKDNEGNSYILREVK